MVFIIDQNGRPCEQAHFVRLDHCVPPRGACAAPVFKGSHWLVCLFQAILAPIVIAAYIVGLVVIIILSIFVPGILARYLCSFRRYLYRLRHCRDGNGDPCLLIGRRTV